MKYFGTDGIRGIYGRDLTERLAYRAGLAASRFFVKCFVGTDTRTSGESLAAAVAEGLAQGGCDAMLTGVIPTPAVSFLAEKHGAGGIVVSASHNPPCYNGLKFFSPAGYKLTAYVESSIEECIDKPPPRVGGGSITVYNSGRDEYVSHLVGLCKIERRRIALDCAYGAAATVARDVFEGCGASVEMYADSLDGEKINCGVGALYPQFVVERAAGKLGFSFDGDADRVVAVDGEVLDGDSTLFNLALILAPKGVVGTIMNNMALERALAERGIPFIRTAVGDKHIGEAMRRHRFSLGGEQSGHYIISPAVSGDGLFAALVLASRGNFERLDLVPQVEISVPASASVLTDPRFVAAKTSCEASLHGRLIVRMSGTEPKIRIMAESENESMLHSVTDKLLDTILSIEKEI